jgi:hypothetical protein
MEIKSHLSEAELAEFVSDPSWGLGTHLQLCDSCLGEVARMRETVAAMRAAGTEGEAFWVRQRRAIRTKMAAASHRPPRTLPRLAWAGGLAMVAVACLMLNDAPRPAPVAQQLQIDPDHELLVAVEQVMRSNGPEALEPATYFVREISQDARSTSTSSNRKSRSRDHGYP